MSEQWSFFRRLLEQGMAIQRDDAAGKYPTYEHLSARLDEAARERDDEWNRRPTPAADVPSGGMTPTSGVTAERLLSLVCEYGNARYDLVTYATRTR